MADAASSEPKTGGDASADEQSAGDGSNGQWVEDRFEQWGRRLGRFVASAAALAREQAEDIVAEAQSIRRGERD